MAVVNEKTFLEIRLPGVGVACIEQCTRICDVCEGIVVLFSGDRVREMTRWVDVAV